MRIAVLDDYQGLAGEMADWNSLGRHQVDFIPEPIPTALLITRLADYEVLVLMRERTRLGAEVLGMLTKLKLVVTTGMANASLDIKHLVERGVVVCGTGADPDLPAPGSGDDLAGVDSTVETTWALILALVKRVTIEDRAVRAGKWQTGLVDTLSGSTLGLLGLGRLGSQMVAPARAFGMRVIAWSEHLEEERARECGAELVSREALFADADILSIHLQLSERTRGLVSGRDIASMKSSALIFNTSRGPIIDGGALAAALTGGAIAGAGLDVFDHEPLPSGASILSAPNTVLLPHLGYATRRGLTNMYRQAVEDIAAFLDGEPIRVLEP